MPWGDYGDILLSGMAAPSPEHDGLLTLERTGPFIPPISFPGLSIVVTESFKALLQASGLSGLAFRPVIKRHIVELHWETWNRTLPTPWEYPESYEPEDYILARPHVPEIAAQMENVWELCLGEHARVKRVPNTNNPVGVDIFVVPSSWDGTDWFQAEGVLYYYVSERAKRWLEQTVAELVSFRPARLREEDEPDK